MSSTVQRSGRVWLHLAEGALQLLVLVLLPAGVAPLGAAASRSPLRHRRGGMAPGFAEILARMNDAAKRLKSLTANLEYTTVTVLVDDKSTEYGQIFFRKAKDKDRRPEILIKFERPDPKTILFRRNKAEIYNPKINQIQEYDLGRHSELVQHFLLLGFGTEVGDLQKSWDLKLAGEEDIGDETAAVLELAPRRRDIAGQLSKVELWISEESWLPVQQKFFQPGGDYLVARYSGTKVNRDIPSATFELGAAEGAKRVKTN